jgi:hypothetical protein
MGKKIVSSSNLLLLRQEIFLCGDVLKGQRIMLIKWENFGAFLSRILTRENILARDMLNEFYCTFIYNNASNKSNLHTRLPVIIFTYY